MDIYSQPRCPRMIYSFVSFIMFFFAYEAQLVLTLSCELWYTFMGAFIHKPIKYKDKRGDVHLQAEKVPKPKNTTSLISSVRWLDPMCLLWIPCVSCAVRAPECLHAPRPACLCRAADGRVGGWVLSAHASSCGSVVPLLFSTQARRACQTLSVETYQGCRGVFW